MNANKTDKGLLSAFVKCAACLALLVLSLSSVACEPSDKNDATANFIESVTTQHQSDNMQQSEHQNHTECDSKCCDGVCECKLGSCFNFTTMVAHDLKSISAPSSSHFYFSNFYHFYSGFSLLRPPKLHLIS
jgi:hypothetical protein